MPLSQLFLRASSTRASVRRVCGGITSALGVSIKRLARQMRHGVGGMFFGRWRLFLQEGDHAFTRAGCLGAGVVQ